MFGVRLRRFEGYFPEGDNTMTTVQRQPGLSTVDYAQTSQAKPLFAASLPVSDRLDIRFGQSQAPSEVSSKALQEQSYVADFRKGGVVVAGGGGTMGSAIAANYLNSDVPVYLLDKEQRFADNGRKNIETGFADAVQRGLFTETEAREKAARMRGTYAMDDGGIRQIDPNAALAIEAVFENEDLKDDIFRQMDAHFSPNTILATNTSSLSVNRLAQAVSPERRKNFVGIHYFLPANKNRFIEVIKGADTSQETIDRTVALVKSLGKTPIVCQKDSPGFVVNRMLVPMMNEGIRVWDRMVLDNLSAYGVRQSDMGKGELPTILPQAVRDQVEATAATNIEQSVKEVLWPTISKNPKASGFLIGPFSGLNSPDYMGLIGEIAQIMHGELGDGYTPAQSILDKSAEFNAIGGKRAPKEQLDALKFKLAGPEAINRSQVEQLKRHFQGLMIGVACQLVDEGVASPSDINKGVMLGTRWEQAPFEFINKIGPKKALALVQEYRKTNPAFKLPQVLVAHARENNPFDLDYVTSRKEGPTAYITIDKIQRNNALDMSMLEKLEAAFDKMNNDPSVKTIIFESVGGKHFVSGADIFALMDQMNEIKATAKRRYRKLPKPLQNLALMTSQYRAIYPFLRKGDQLYDKVAKSKKVTVAKVNGTALGGGTELALACDWVVAAEDASFGLPEVKYGIFPAWGGTERLAQKIGKPLAKFMILEGGKMDDKGGGDAILSAENAAYVGLADVVVPAANLDADVADMLSRGAFYKNPIRHASPPYAHSVHTSAGYAAKNFSETPYAAKQERYQSASLSDLLGNELSGLFKPAAALAFKRIERGEKPNRLTQERELLQMASNMSAAQAQAKKASKKAGD